MFTRFEELRAEMGVTKISLAEKLNRTSTIFQDWKQGKSKPSVYQLKVIAEALNTTPEYLTGETDEKRPAQDGPLDEKQEEIRRLLSLLSDEEAELVLRQLKGLTQGR